MMKNSFLLACFIYLFNSIGNVSQGVLIKYYQHSLSIGLYELMAIKCFVACLLTLPFSIKYILNFKKDLHIVILLAVLYSMDLLLCNTGFKTVPVNTGVLILLLVPLWIIVFSRMILKEKEFNAVNAIMLIVCLIGVFIPIRREIEFNGFNIGYIYLFLASIVIPLGLILQKKFTDKRPLPYALFTNALVLGVICFLLCRCQIKVINIKSLTAGVIVACCDLVEFIAVYVAYAMTEASLLQPIRFTRIVISMFLSWLILHEIPTNSQMIGAVLIIVSNAISILYSKNCQDKK